MKKNTENLVDFITAGKSQGTYAVTMTLLATIIGASASIGVTDTVYNIGFPGIWWLVFGVIGLVLQALLLSEKVRNLDANTLPELTAKIVGKPAAVLLASVIVISWIGVIAGQFVALNSLVTFALGKTCLPLFLVLSVLVIGYTAFGGQRAVIRTDRYQMYLILFGILACFVFLLFVKDGVKIPAEEFKPLNENYGPFNLLNQFFVIGGVYFLGPDILSRNFVAKDAKTAKKSALFAAGALFLFACVITLIGLWTRVNIPELENQKALLAAIRCMPKGLMLFPVLGLLCAVLSSTDTCIVNAASIFANDILHTEKVWVVRVVVAVLGCLGLGLAILGRGDILSLLTGAYSIYTPGVIFPLLIAILAHGKRKLRLGVWLAAVAAGGIFGLVGTYGSALLANLGLPEAILSNLSLIGMGISALLGLCSLGKKNEENVPA